MWDQGSQTLFGGQRCPTCGTGMTWIPQYQSFYCATCRRYVSPNQQSNAPQCPYCGQHALFYSHQYQRWYCNYCRRYTELPAGTVAAAPTPSVAPPPVVTGAAAAPGPVLPSSVLGSHQQPASGTGAMAPPQIPAPPPAPPAAPAATAENSTIIEDIFLLYNDGRLIRHYTRRLKPTVDSEILGGMLTAVQQFVKETLSGDDAGALEEIKVGKNRIFVHTGRYISAALMIEGEDKESVAGQVKLAVEEMEIRHQDVLASWEGDLAALRPLHDYMNDLLAGRPRV